MYQRIYRDLLVISQSRQEVRNSKISNIVAVESSKSDSMLLAGPFTSSSVNLEPTPGPVDARPEKSPVGHPIPFFVSKKKSKIYPTRYFHDPSFE